MGDARMWRHIRFNAIEVNPRPVTVDMNNRIFIGIYLFPKPQMENGQSFDAVRRDEWHASITTAYWRQELMWRTASPLNVLRAWRRAVVTKQFVERVQVAWNVFYPRAGEVVRFTPSPFGKQSWGFGIDPATILGNALQLLQDYTEGLVRLFYGYELKLRTRRVIHVSWN